MVETKNFRHICLCAVLLLITISENGAANIYVPPGESTQNAVDNAFPGDTILVKPGEYNEDIQTNKDNLTIISDLKNLYKAIFASNVTAGYTPLTVKFTDVSENTNSLWNLGNLGASKSSNFLHTFVNESNYTVTLNVTNEKDSDSADVTINYLKASDTLVPILPEARFEANVTGGHIPLTVQFFDFSENTTLRSWNFGDGKKSCCQNPRHTFCCPGNYKVSLTAENENGSSSACTTIMVLKPTNQTSTGNIVNPEDITGSSRGNESNSTERYLNKKNLESEGDLALSFTVTPSPTEVESSIEHEMFKLMDSVKNITENLVSRTELRKLSMRVLFSGFLGTSLGISSFGRS